MAQEDVRIVIPAYNAQHTIVACVEAIKDAILFTNSWEIVIVDNGENYDLPGLLKKYPVKILRRHEASSAAYARNEGAKGFNSGLLVFIDSDVICENICIKQLIKPIKEGLCHATIGNYSKNLNGLTFSQKYKQLYLNHTYDRGGTIRNDFWTAISSVDAEVFHKLNGFNSNFKGASGEDQEFGIRLTKNDFFVLPVKEAYGQHRNPYGVFNIIKNDFKKGVTAIQNSLDNEIPLSDNRHSKRTDILAVLFSSLTVFFLFISWFYTVLLEPTLIFFSLWFISRIKLSIAFFKNEGVSFFVRAITLMFILDLVRCSCVIVGVAITKSNFLKGLLGRKTNS